MKTHIKSKKGTITPSSVVISSELKEQVIENAVRAGIRQALFSEYVRAAIQIVTPEMVASFIKEDSRHAA